MDHVIENKGGPGEAAGWAGNLVQELVENALNLAGEMRAEKHGDEEMKEEDHWTEGWDEIEEIDEEIEVGVSQTMEKIALGGGSRSLQEDEMREAVRRGGKTDDSVKRDREEATGENEKENEAEKECDTRKTVKWERGGIWTDSTTMNEEANGSKSIVKVRDRFSWYSPVTVMELVIAGWRCLFLVLKTIETALAVSPRSSPYSLDLICSLRHLSIPRSSEEIHRRVRDNYAAFSGEHYRLLRSLVCCCVCRFVSPWRVVLAAAFLGLCGFLPLEDRRVGPYLMPRDFQMVFLCFVALCVTSVMDTVAWSLLLACPFAALHLLLHDSSTSSHRPLFSNLVWG